MTTGWRNMAEASSDCPDHGPVLDRLEGRPGASLSS
jgi:hypothetical protein